MNKCYYIDWILKRVAVAIHISSFIYLVLAWVSYWIYFNQIYHLEKEFKLFCMVQVCVEPLMLDGFLLYLGPRRVQVRFRKYLGEPWTSCGRNWVPRCYLFILYIPGISFSSAWVVIEEAFCLTLWVLLALILCEIISNPWVWVYISHSYISCGAQFIGSKSLFSSGSRVCGELSGTMLALYWNCVIRNLSGGMLLIFRNALLVRVASETWLRHLFLLHVRK